MSYSQEALARREHNAEAVEDFLLSYRDRFPSGPQEILRVENRKMESKAPLKKANYLRLNDRPYYGSDQVLLGILGWLADYFPDLYAALDPPYLNPDTSVSEIDRYKKLATGKTGKAKEARDLLRSIREAKKKIVEMLELVKWVDGQGRLRRGHRLNMPTVKRARLKEVAVPKERQPKIVDEFLDNYEACGKISEAVRLTAKSTDYRKSWIYHICRDARKEIKERGEAEGA